MKSQKIKMTIEGESGQIDGYVESIIGMFVITGQILSSPEVVSHPTENGKVKFHIELELKPSPLGNLGDTWK